MQRLFLFLLLALFVVAVSPPLRTRVEPAIRPALNPIYEWNTRNQVGSVFKDLETERILGRTLPAPRDLDEFIEQKNPGQNESVDAWGNPLYLEVTRRTFRVGSPGRDGIAKTADDILSEMGQR